MKTRKMFAVMLAVMYLIMTLTGCANNTVSVYDTGITNSETYQNYESWEVDNQVRLVVDIKVHQIGFRSDKTLIIEEGITDALTDMICCYIGIKPVLTEYYFSCRTLAYQLLKADPEIVSCYLNNNGFVLMSIRNCTKF